MSSARREVAEVVAAAKAQGWRVEQTPTGHWKGYPPNKAMPMVSFGGNHVGPRAQENEIAQLRRSGLVWPWPPEKAARRAPLSRLSLSSEPVEDDPRWAVAAAPVPDCPEPVEVPPEPASPLPAFAIVPVSPPVPVTSTLASLLEAFVDAREVARVADELVALRGEEVERANQAYTAAREDAVQARAEMTSARAALDRALDSDALGPRTFKTCSACGKPGHEAPRCPSRAIPGGDRSGHGNQEPTGRVRLLREG